MMIRKFLPLLAAFSALILVTASGCAAESDDDDDGGFPTQTPTATPTATASPTPTPTPPAQDMIARSSFIAAGGTELWLCLESQFDGQIDNIFTDDGGTCTATSVNLGLASSVLQPSFHLILFDGLTGCGAGDHDWYVDYLVDDGRCPTGCVSNEYLVTEPADDAFGTVCGVAGNGAVPLTSLSAYLSATTGEHRFTAVAGPDGSVEIDLLRIYDVDGTALQTVCTASAAIVSNGTGLFDTSCNPAVTLTPATTYSAMVAGTVSDVPFVGRIDFDYVDTPAPQ